MFYYFSYTRNYLDIHELTEERLINSLALGFDLALQAGPLCEEPIIGACFIVEEVSHQQEPNQQEVDQDSKSGGDLKQQFNNDDDKKTGLIQDTYGPITGYVWVIYTYAKVIVLRDERCLLERLHRRPTQAGGVGL